MWSLLHTQELLTEYLLFTVFTNNGLGMANILRALIHIAQNGLGIPTIKDMSSSSDLLELYVQAAFAESLSSPDDFKSKVNTAISYQGGKNYSPDIVLTSGDAIEVKKLRRMTSEIPFNSSRPKQRLKPDDPHLKKDYPSFFQEEKDMCYVIGIKGNNTKTIDKLWFVYGDCYFANSAIYDDLFNRTQDAIKEASKGLLLTESKELARFKEIDALNITSLRVRPMWSIKNPIQFFHQELGELNLHKANVVCVMRESKFMSLQEDIQTLKSHLVDIPDPDKVNSTIEARIITF